MFNKLPTLVALCTVGLMACGQGTASGPQADTITLKLSQMEDGDLQYCDEETGECFDLPYDGECVIVEVDIDPATGATCERCITESGEVIDLGCTDTSVGCVVVTLPEPDCVVCAYVNGAVIFSSCVAEDEPECLTDIDCATDNGMHGFCLDGQCVYEGCVDDSQCPPGFQCQFPPVMNPEDPTTTFPVGGTCVPRDIECQTDDDCPADMMCDFWCWNEPVDCPPGADCMPPEECRGVCIERPYDPCENFQCDQGQHCELMCWEANGEPTEPACDPDDPDCPSSGAMMPPGGCEPVCVDDPSFCTSDADCEDGEVCEKWCDDIGAAPACDPDMDDCDFLPPPCEGICVPHIPDPCDDVVCADGQHCEMMCYFDMAFPCTDNDPWCGCEPVCVDEPTSCLSDADCGENETCERWCVEPQWDCDPSAGNDCPEPPPCEGVCVPYVPNPCDDLVCEQGQHCEVVCTGVVDSSNAFPCENDPYCGCEAVCVDDPVSCASDADCADDEVCEMWCVEPQWDCAPGTDCMPPPCEGVCVSVPTEIYCYSDEDCRDGQVCEFYGTTEPVQCDSSDPNCGGLWAPGVCVPVVEPNDCFRTGCNGEICADQPMDSVCMYQEEYVCLELATCERQQDGACGWTPSEEYEMCIEQFTP